MQMPKAHLSWELEIQFLGVITVWMTNPLLDHNGPQLTLPLISGPGLCAPGIQGSGRCPHVSSPWDGRSMGDPIWGMLLLGIFGVPFFR